jgi:hypothetical protein
MGADVDRHRRLPVAIRPIVQGVLANGWTARAKNARRTPRRARLRPNMAASGVVAGAWTPVLAWATNHQNLLWTANQTDKGDAMDLAVDTRPAQRTWYELMSIAEFDPATVALASTAATSFASAPHRPRSIARRRVRALAKLKVKARGLLAGCIPARVITTRVGRTGWERTRRPVLGGHVPGAAVLELFAHLAARLTVRSRLLVFGLYLLALRARVVVVVNVALTRLLLGLRVIRGHFRHGTPLLLSSNASCLVYDSARPCAIVAGMSGRLTRSVGQVLAVAPNLRARIIDGAHDNATQVERATDLQIQSVASGTSCRAVGGPSRRPNASDIVPDPNCAPSVRWCPSAWRWLQARYVIAHTKAWYLRMAWSGPRKYVASPDRALADAQFAKIHPVGPGSSVGDPARPTVGAAPAQRGRRHQSDLAG